MKLRASLMVFMVGCVGSAGCDRGPDHPAASPAKPSPTARSFPLKGVVRKVDQGSGEVTIAHEEIPGFMPKMTMPFTLKDKDLLNHVKPGDEVEGRLEVAYEGDQVKDYDLAGLKVTRPAPASSPVDFGIEAPRPEMLKPGQEVPDFAMTTQEGKTLKLSDLRGEVVVLTFIYTRCPMPEFCPAMDAKFAELSRRISAVPSRSGAVRLLSVSFDPEHDTPEVLAAHAARRGARPPLWTFAVATHDELARVAGPLGLSYAAGTREIEHNLRAALIGPDGTLALVEVGPGWAPADLFKAIRALVPSPGK